MLVVESLCVPPLVQNFNLIAPAWHGGLSCRAGRLRRHRGRARAGGPRVRRDRRGQHRRASRCGCARWRRRKPQASSSSRRIAPAKASSSGSALDRIWLPRGSPITAGSAFWRDEDCAPPRRDWRLPWRRRPRAARSPADELSGGNQQKLAFGRSIGDAPGVLLMNEPTRGVDVGARADIYRLIRQFCDRGYCVVMASSDIEEVLGMADVVVTMYRGRQVGSYRARRSGHAARAGRHHPSGRRGMSDIAVRAIPASQKWLIYDGSQPEQSPAL